MVRSWLKKLREKAKWSDFKREKEERKGRDERDELGEDETDDPRAGDDSEPRSLGLPAAGGKHGRVAEKGDVGVLSGRSRG